MEKILVKLAKILVSNDVIWLLLKPLVFIGIHLQIKRKQYLDSAILNKYNVPKLFNELIVLNGPFKGMKYPNLLARGSAIYPKLLGSYESELHEVINIILKRDYSVIIDVGCAEGYYAIGFAKYFPQAKIFAYDIDMEARHLCREMGRLNNISDDKLTILSNCSAEDLNKYNFSGGGLVISDCEGFEKHLFGFSNISNLKNCDLLIEVHDCIDINISSYLKNLFQNSHSLKIIKSVGDIEKAKVYDFGIKELPASVKEIVFRERVGIMEWFYFRKIEITP